MGITNTKGKKEKDNKKDTLAENPTPDAQKFKGTDFLSQKLQAP